MFGVVVHLCYIFLTILFCPFLSEALETINFQKLNSNDIKYLDKNQVSLICVPLPSWFVITGSMFVDFGVSHY